MPPRAMAYGGVHTMAPNRPVTAAPASLATRPDCAVPAGLAVGRTWHRGLVRDRGHAAAGHRHANPAAPGQGPAIQASWIRAGPAGSPARRDR